MLQELIAKLFFVLVSGFSLFGGICLIIIGAKIVKLPPEAPGEKKKNLFKWLFTCAGVIVFVLVFSVVINDWAINTLLMHGQGTSIVSAGQKMLLDFWNSIPGTK